MRLIDRTVSRREWARLSAAGIVSAGTSGWFHQVAAAAHNQDPRPGRKKSCILLGMNGGPSQQHTFDLKPGGAYKPIATAVPGIEVCEYLPRVAAQMQDFAVLRSMSTGEIEHERACFLLQTSYRQVGAAEYPPLGSIVSAELGDPAAELPNYVAIDGGIDGRYIGVYRPGPAYLGPRHAPLIVEDPAKGVENLKPTVQMQDLVSRAELLAQAERGFAQRYASDAAHAHRTTFQQALRLMRSNQAQAFDIQRETSAVREAYGDSKFGRACLLARRLVEVGVSFVEVRLEGWDDHSGATPLVKGRCEYLDPAMAALVGDLKSRGMLDDTLVIWMGEFGRAPGDGKNHWPGAWTTVLAGAGLNVGQVIGSTDNETGGEVTERPISEIDFLATICRALEIDHTKEYIAAGGRPVALVDNLREEAKIVEQLF